MNDDIIFIYIFVSHHRSCLNFLEDFDKKSTYPTRLSADDQAGSFGSEVAYRPMEFEDPFIMHLSTNQYVDVDFNATMYTPTGGAVSSDEITTHSSPSSQTRNPKRRPDTGG